MRRFRFFGCDALNASTLPSFLPAGHFARRERNSTNESPDDLATTMVLAGEDESVRRRPSHNQHHHSERAG
jgi:hypothetical protein